MLRLTAVALLATGGCALFVVAAHPAWGEVNWGDAPTWANALITLLALLAAAFVVRIELGRERKARELEAERRTKQASGHQADFVAAWCGPSQAAAGDFRLFIGNSTPLPIYDVAVTWVLPDGVRVDDELLNLVGPDRTGATELSLPNVVLSERERFRGSYQEFCGALRVSMRFQDTASRVWRRDERGALHFVGDAVIGSPAAVTASVSIATEGVVGEQND